MSKAPKHNEPVKRGRPSKFTPEVANEICERLSSGETLTSICADDHMPADRTVDDWVNDDVDGFSASYMRARARWHDSIAHRARETARGLGDSKQDVARDKLIIDTDMRLLACWDRNRYGTQRIEADVTNKTEHDASKMLAQADALLGKAFELIDARVK